MIRSTPVPARSGAAAFAKHLIAWQRRSGRHDLPWQRTRDPYRIWLSEIMLQQTQVRTVIPYYERFITRFPSIAALARADVGEVLQLWSGLGYYSRARNLHRAAVVVLDEHRGEFPGTRSAIERLPGIGRSTAAAIAAFAFGVREAILDGNVKRVLARHFIVDGIPTERAVEQRLWALAESLLPARSIDAYTQGIMDLGATICTLRKPRCTECPVRTSCKALAANVVDRYPARRRKPPLPQRRTTMLVLFQAGDVLLERRPPTGLWGGLWSLPEVAESVEIETFVRRRFAFAVKAQQPLGLVKHGFTHFKLDIHPVLVTGHGAAHAAEPGVVWMPLADARTAALPVPVKRILDGLPTEMSALTATTRRRPARARSARARPAAA